MSDKPMFPAMAGTLSHREYEIAIKALLWAWFHTNGSDAKIPDYLPHDDRHQAIRHRVADALAEARVRWDAGASCPCLGGEQA